MISGDRDTGGIQLRNGRAIFASPLTNIPNTCTNAVNAPCLSTSQFAPSAAVTGAPTGFGTVGRNSVYGLHFFDVDIALSKSVAATEHVNFTFGAQAYNAFNHTNFDEPVGDISNPQFGSSIAAVGPPTSLLARLLGRAVHRDSLRSGVCSDFEPQRVLTSTNRVVGW